MRRRELLKFSGAALIAWPATARAQQASKVWRLGYLGFGTAAAFADRVEALRAGLRPWCVDLFGDAEQLNLTAAVQLGGNATTKPGEQLGAQFIKPGFLRRDQSLELNLGLLKQSLVAYDQRALIERIGITRKLSPHWSVQVGILAERGEGDALAVAGDGRLDVVPRSRGHLLQRTVRRGKDLLLDVL